MMQSIYYVFLEYNKRNQESGGGKAVNYQLFQYTAGQGMNVPHDGYFYITLPGRVE